MSTLTPPTPTSPNMKNGFSPTRNTTSRNTASRGRQPGQVGQETFEKDEEQGQLGWTRDRRKMKRNSTLDSVTSSVAPSDTESSMSRRSSVTSLETPSSTRSKHAPHSILRRAAPPSAFHASSSTSSLDAHSLSRATSSTSLSDFSPGDMPGISPRPVQRRSSRVRFSDEILPPTLPSPTLEILPTSRRERFGKSGRSEKSGRSKLRRGTSIEGLRDDLKRSSRALATSLDRRASAASFTSIISDQFTLHESQQQPLPPSSSSRISTTSIPELEDGFTSRPLPYPKLSRRSSAQSTDTARSITISVYERDSEASSPTTRLNEANSRSSLALSSSSRYNGRSRRDSLASLAGSLLSPTGSSAGSRPTSFVFTQDAYSLGPTSPGMVDNSASDGGQRGSPNKRSSSSSIAPILVNRIPDSLVPPASRLEMSNPVEIRPPSPTNVKAIHPDSGSRIETARLFPPASFDTTKKGTIDLIMPNRTHQRTDSSLSAVLSFPMVFPIPPSRQTLEVSIASSSEMSTIEELDTPRPRPALTLAVVSSTQSTPPSSPPLSAVMARKSPKIDIAEGDDDDESDLDVTLPLADVAVKRGILSPNSRLVNTKAGGAAKPPVKSSTGTNLTVPTPTLTPKSMSIVKDDDASKGWSGSDSEEEEFVKAIRAITLRKLSGLRAQLRIPRLTSPSKTRTLTPESPNIANRAKANRLSSLSYTSGSSAMSSTESSGPVTPCLSITRRPVLVRTRASSGSSSSSTVPGDYPWGGDGGAGGASGPSSPTASFRTSSGSSKTFYDQFRRSTESDASGGSGIGKGQGAGGGSNGGSRRGSRLPTPTREVEGWGKPEILIDEDWSADMMDSDSPDSDSAQAPWSVMTPADDGDDDDDDQGESSRTMVGMMDETPLLGGGVTPKAAGGMRVSSPDLLMMKMSMSGGGGGAGGMVKMGLGLGLGQVGEWGSFLSEDLPTWD